MSFLAEVRQTEKKNLAIEALKEAHQRRRALAGTAECYPVKGIFGAACRRRSFAIMPTPSRTAQVARGADPASPRTSGPARSRGEETGLSDDEIAFYDALAENEECATNNGRSLRCG